MRIIYNMDVIDVELANDILASSSNSFVDSLASHVSSSVENVAPLLSSSVENLAELEKRSLNTLNAAYNLQTEAEKLVGITKEIEEEAKKELEYATEQSIEAEKALNIALQQQEQQQEQQQAIIHGQVKRYSLMCAIQYYSILTRRDINIAERFTHEQLDDFTNEINSIDTNGDGIISIEEAKKFINDVKAAAGDVLTFYKNIPEMAKVPEEQILKFIEYQWLIDPDSENVLETLQDIYNKEGKNTTNFTTNKGKLKEAKTKVKNTKEILNTKKDAVQRALAKVSAAENKVKNTPDHRYNGPPLNS